MNDFRAGWGRVYEQDKRSRWAGQRPPLQFFDQEFLDGTSPRIYQWNQSKI